MSTLTYTNNKLKGRRYSDQEKAEILAHVKSVNAEKGRGGIAAAAEKYKVTPLTISNWIRQRGISVTPLSSHRQGNEFAKNLRRLADLHESIVNTERELSGLHREFGRLKATL